MRTHSGISTTLAIVAIVVAAILVGAGVYAATYTGNHTITTTSVSTATSTATSVSTATSTATSTTTATTTAVATTTVTATTTSSTVTAPPIVIQRNAAFSDADPRDTSSIDVVQQSYETLTYLSANGTVLPGLATSWKSINGSIWQYTLRQGVTFHDGSPFNATAVVFSIQNTILWGGGDAPDVWAFFKSVSVVSTYVVDISFTQIVNAPLVTSAAYAAFIFSPNILKYAGLPNTEASLTTGLHSWFNAYNDDGTGPYVISPTQSSLANGIWVLNQYKNYWGGWKPGQITKITFDLVTNVNTAIQLATQGQLDVIGVSGQFQYVPQLLQAGLNVVSGPTHGSIWLLFNTQHQYLNNPTVRQALLTAINYQQVVQQAYYGYGINFNGVINPGLAYYNSVAPGYPVTGNLTQAKALLASAGYPSGLPNLQLTLTYSTGSPFEATIAQLLNTYWQPLGVTVNLDGLTFTNQAIKAGYVNGTESFEPGPISYAATSSAQDLVLLNWNGATADPWLVPDELFAIQPAPYQNDILYNWSYLQNSQFTQLLNQFSVDEANNPTQAATDVNSLNSLFNQLAPGVALFQGEQIWVVNPHWHGIVMNPNYSFDYFFYYNWTYSP